MDDADPDLVIRGGEVLTAAGRRRLDVVVAGGRVGDVVEPGGAPPAREVLDATGLLVAPGLVDLQCNGAVGVDLAAEPERLWEVAAALPRWGVTAWLPTIVSSPAGVVERALAALRAGPPADLADGPLAAPLGLHLEGPYLNPLRAGAHVAGHLRSPRADPGWTARPGVSLVTLAPELDGALELVRDLVDGGVVVAAGHTDAREEEALAGLDAGVTMVTHLFNAMAPLGHRDPGIAGVALTDDRVAVGLIADGEHVAPRVVDLVARAAGDRLVLVSDAVAALGVEHAGGPARRAARLEDGTLAGSTTGLDGMVRNLVAFTGGRVALDDALRAASARPAAVLGLADRGVLGPGAVADAVLVDPTSGRLAATVVAGHVVAGHPVSA